MLSCLWAAGGAFAADAETILLRETRETIALLTLNRPAARNSLSEGLIEALSAAFDDIGRDAAHDTAQAELGKSIYPKPSALELISDWLEEVLYRLTAGASNFPGGWLTVSVLVILVAVAIVVAVRMQEKRAVLAAPSAVKP